MLLLSRKRFLASWKSLPFVNHHAVVYFLVFQAFSAIRSTRHTVLTETHKRRRLGGQNARSIWYIIYVDWTHCDLVPIDELFGG